VGRSLIRSTSAGEITALGEGVRTAAVLAVVALVAIAAAADALRGGHSAPAAPAATAGPPPPPHGALHGSLWYADAGCHLHRLDLATGRDRTLTPSSGHCRFWVSPDRRHVAMHTGRPFTPPQALELLDVASGRITTPFRRPDLAFSPPAWSPDSRTLVTCDGSRGPPSLRAYHLDDRRVTTPVADACYPAYVGDRLAYRGLDLVTRIDGRRIADARTLGKLMHRDVDQDPGPAGAARVLAIAATTVTPAGGPAPITTVVLFHGDGHVIGRWDTGAIADTVALLGGGRIIVVSRRAGLVLDDRRTGGVITSAAGRPIISAAVAPGGAELALADGRSIVITNTSGRARWSLPVRTRWIQWTR
jgi:hypothetical protein